MSRAFFYKWSDKQTINDVDQAIGRLALPSGKYVITGEASVIATKLNGAIDFNQPLECRLKAGAIEDGIMLNVWSDRFQGGNWALIALNICVNFEGGIAELTCTHGNPGCIAVFDVALSAMQVDKLQINNADPSSDHKPYWHTQIQDQTHHLRNTTKQGVKLFL